MAFNIGLFFQVTLFYFILYALLIVILATDTYITKENKRTFFIAIFLCTLLIVVDYIGSLASQDSLYLPIRYTVSIIGYSIRPFIITFLLKLSMPDQKHIIWHIFGTINLVLYVTTPFTHWCIYFEDNSRFMRGPLWMLIFILCGIELLFLTYASIIEHYKKYTRHWLLPPLCSLLIFHAVYQDYETRTNEYVSNLNKMLPLVMILFYIFYHLQLVAKYQSEILEKQQLQLMVSQIKPHFFFNTITTIQALCHIDPQKASDTLGTFANYVRQNITTQTDNLIPFEQELKHLKAYVDIEMLRFTNIEVRYDLQITDFDIAAFSIQPIIENSIKHGIRSREHGIVTLQTLKTEKAIIITIEDNGTGFDLKLLETLDDTHIGIKNVRNRLKILQDATMNITSSNNGTTVTITIPREN